MKPIIRPAGKLHGAGLLVEGEELHIDLTRGLEDGRAEPGHIAILNNVKLQYTRLKRLKNVLQRILVLLNQDPSHIAILDNVE